MGVVIGFGLPAAGVAVYGLLRDMGVVLHVNYWHFLVAPSLGGVVGYSLGQGSRHRRALGRAAREAAEHAQTLLDELGAGVYKSTLDGKLVYASRGLSTLFGYESAAELMSASTHRLYAHPEDRKALLEALTQGRPMDGRAFSMVTKAGEVFSASITAHVQGGLILGTVSKVAAGGDDAILVICSNCDRARNQAGDWQKLSRFLMENAAAIRTAGCAPVFSHGLCEPCAELLYGDILKD